jgi:hypothetical protein
MPASSPAAFAVRFVRMAASRPHLAAALLATTISAIALVCGVIYAHELESRYVRDLSKVKLPMEYHFEIQGGGATWGGVGRLPNQTI